VNNINNILQALHDAYQQFDISIVKDHGSCPVKTNDFNQDLFLFWVEQEYGIKLHQHSGVGALDTFDILDEQKYTVFLLKWA
jgi:hypothetical protein